MHRKHLIIPVHPPKFAYLFNSFGGIANKNLYSDVFLTLVTTSEIESEMLRNYIMVSSQKIPFDYEIISATKICDVFNLPKSKQAIISNKDNGIVNFKKMVSLWRAFQAGADEVMCIDCDVLFFRDADKIFDRLRTNFARKDVIAGTSGLARDIILTSIDHMKDSDKEKIRKLYKDGKIYSWFFDAPFYPKEETLRWFKYMIEKFSSVDEAISSFTWGTFEHLIFQMYLVLYEGFIVRDVSKITGDRIPEEFWIPEVFRVMDETGYAPVWVNLSGLLSFISDEDLNKARNSFMMAMHVDRVPGRLD